MCDHQDYHTTQLNLQGGTFGSAIQDFTRNTDTYSNRKPSNAATMCKRRRHPSLSDDPKRIRLETHRKFETDTGSDLPWEFQSSTSTPQTQSVADDVSLTSAVTEWVQLSDDVLRRVRNNTGCRLAGKGRLRRAVVTWQNAAGAGSAAAHFNLAVCYQRGLGVTRDTDQAVSHYRAAAGLGHGGALYNLAILTHQGALGLQQHPGDATQLLQMAADAGVPQAFRELGVVHATSVPRDMCTADNLFKAASLSQDPGADYFLAQCYQYGLGVQRDPCQATRLYSRAEARGRPHHPHHHHHHSQNLPDLPPRTEAYDPRDIQEHSIYSNESDVSDVDMLHTPDDVTADDITSTISDDVTDISYNVTDAPKRQEDVYLNIITEVIMVPWSCLTALPNPKTDFSFTDLDQTHSQRPTNICYKQAGRGPRLLRLPSHFNYGIVEDFDASMFQHYGICDKQKTIDELKREYDVARENRSSMFPPFSNGRGLLSTAGFRCNSAILEDGLC